MAFSAKIDFSSLSTIIQNALVIRDDNLNGTEQKYQPTGQYGEFVATEIYGDTTAPTNAFGLKSGVTVAANAIKLGKITSIGTGSSAKKYALESIEIDTSGGNPVAISATSRQVEDGAADGSYFAVPGFTLSKEQIAQILFGAFTVGGSGCHLTDTKTVIGCTVRPDDVAGVLISSDVNSGAITISGTILSVSGTVPTITPDDENGWTLTKAPAIYQSNPEKEYKKYTFEVQKLLPKTRPTTPSSQQPPSAA